MRQITFWIVFLAVNFLLILLHLWIFRGPYPYAAWATGFLHLMLFIYVVFNKLKR
ncbi:MAG: hypothetical protein ABW174_13870 [Flavitalea sp.]